MKVFIYMNWYNVILNFECGKTHPIKTTSYHLVNAIYYWDAYLLKNKREPY